MGKTIRISFENICWLQVMIKIKKRGCRYGELFVTSVQVNKCFKGNLIDEERILGTYQGTNEVAKSYRSAGQHYMTTKQE